MLLFVLRLLISSFYVWNAAPRFVCPRRAQGYFVLFYYVLRPSRPIAAGPAMPAARRHTLAGSVSALALRRPLARTRTLDRRFWRAPVRLPGPQSLRLERSATFCLSAMGDVASSRFAVDVFVNLFRCGYCPVTWVGGFQLSHFFRLRLSGQAVSSNCRWPRHARGPTTHAGRVCLGARTSPLARSHSHARSPLLARAGAFAGAAVFASGTQRHVLSVHDG